MRDLRIKNLRRDFWMIFFGWGSEKYGRCVLTFLGNNTWRLSVRLYSKRIPAGREKRRTAVLPGSPARFKCFSGLEQALHPQREAHVAGDPKLAAHESDLPIQLPRQHIEVVLCGHRDGDVGRGIRPFENLNILILDDNLPLSATIAGKVKLINRVESLRRFLVEAAGHYFKSLLGSRGCFI